MKEYLVYSEDGSNKFWSISTQGNTFTVVFGKVGTAGQTQIKSFDSAEEAEAQAKKQTASKIKKGYKPAMPTEGFGAAPAPDTVNAKAAPAKPKKAANPPKAPAAAVDDGTLQPWHQEGGDFWEYSWHCPDEEDFAMDALSRPEENDSSGADTPAQPARKTPAAKEEKPQLYWGDGNYGDDDNEDDDDSPGADFSVSGFARLCYEKPLAEVQKAWNDAVSAGVGQDKLQRALNEGVERIFTYSLYAHGLENLPWILEKGGTLEDVDDADEPYAKYFCKEYSKVNDPAKAAGILDGFLDRAYSEMAPKLGDGLAAVLQAIETGEYDKESGVERLPTNEELEWCTGFRLRTYQDRFYVYIDTKKKSQDTLFRGRFDNADEINECVAAKYLPQKLRPLIEKMGQDGLFDKLGIPSVNIRYYDTGGVFFHKILDEKLVEQKKQEAVALVKRLEASTQFEEDAPLLGDAVSFLLRGPLEQDVPRASALIGRFLYSLNDEAEEQANQMLCDYDDEYPQLQYDRALWLHNNGDYKPAHNVMGFAADKGYAPAKEKRREFEELARQRALLAPKSGSGDSAKKAQKGGKKNLFQTFTEQEVLLNTENIIARAYSNGNICVRFKVEGEEGYAEALDFLCNLLEKGYNRIHDGYTLLVRFVQKPEFIKKLPGFPKNTCHAFFAKAVRYPALREKVRRYADLALVEFDWYKDLDGEENTVPGTFAACALALCDESYIHMAGQYARNSDNEHQYIQLEVAPALLKEYGPMPAVAKALFDISASNGQDGDMGRIPKELYTLPENLNAIMEHIESGVYGQRQLEWHVPQYVETIMTGNLKGNLKKLKGLWQTATALADKKTYADFYNTYKNYASIREEEDYGEDLTSGPVGDIVLPTYHEDPPVVMSLAEFEAKYPDTKIEFEYPAERRTVLFIPHVVDNPYLLDYAFRQWEVLSKIAREAPSSYFWYPTVIQMGDWVINLTAPAKEYGVILYDCKAQNARPIVLYGMLNLVPLFSRFHKRPFKSQEEAEAARLANLIEEASDHRPITPEEQDASERYEAVCAVLLNERHYAAGKLLPMFTPEDGRFYDAALIQRAILAHRLVDPVGESALYEELLERKPEFAAYWDEKLKKL